MFPMVFTTATYLKTLSIFTNVLKVHYVDESQLSSNKPTVKHVSFVSQ